MAAIRPSGPTTSGALPVAFFVSAALAAFSMVLYLAGERLAFASVCRYTADLCQHPGWPLVAAAAFLAFGFLFRLNRL